MPPDAAENDDAVELVRTRSDAGFRWLIENVGPQVKGLLIRKFGACGDDPFETAIVEAAETLWLRGEPYDPARGSLVSWLYAAASRVCITMFRAERIRPLVASMPGSLMAEMYEDGNSDRIRSERIAELLEDLRECIAQLTPREQEIILASLSDFDGTDADLGKRLGTTDNVIRVTRTRAHKKLARLMRGLHGEG